MYARSEANALNRFPRETRLDETVKRPTAPTEVLLIGNRDADRLGNRLKAGELVVHQVDDLEEGLCEVASGRFAVVLLELELASPPELHGLRRCLGIAPDLPIVIVAPPEDEAEAKKTLSSGAADYLLTSELSARLVARSVRYCTSHTAATQQDLRENQLREILPLPVVICRQDDAKVIYANTKVGPTFGLTSSQLLKQPLRRFFAERGACEFFHEVIDQVGFFDDYETQVRRSDGTNRAVIVSGQRLHYGGCAAFLLAVNDLTQSRHVERSMRRLEDSFREFFEENLTGNFRCRVDGQLIACNRAFTEIFQLKPSKRGEHWNLRDLHPTTEAFDQFLSALKKRRRLDHFETVLVRKDGSEVDVIQNVVGRFDETGDLREIRGYLFDITEHKTTERQLRQSQKMEAVGLLAGGIAHDFNNLLTAINGYSELLLARIAEEDPLRQDVEEIGKAGQRAASLTKQLLAFSRRQILQPEILNLNEVVTEMDSMLRRLIHEDIELVKSLDPVVGNLKADRGQLEQVIVNLVVNARDAMPNGGRITLETSNFVAERPSVRHGVDLPAGEYVVMRIRDSGEGIEPDVLPRIFEPFFTTKGQGRGTGLGLSTVYGIVKQSNGYIFAESPRDSGATFEIFFARRDEESALISRVHYRPVQLGGRETILLVEDEAAVRNLASLTLQMKGYNLLVAENGERALQICENRFADIDLIVTDVVMPQMSGRELVERVLEIKPDVKVLFLSGYTDEAIGHHGVLGSNLVFMSKPFTPNTLSLKVREVLDHTRPPLPLRPSSTA